MKNNSTKTPPDKLTEFKAYLEIDPDALDEALQTHAELYYHVSEATAMAIAERDEAKFDLDEAAAKRIEKLREEYANNKSKQHVTETMYKNKVLLDPEMRKLQRQVLKLNARVESWMALKDSFYQRSFMLRELTGWVIAHRYDVVNDRGVARDRADLSRSKADSIRQRLGAGRRAKRSN
jgi:hypothetical protein